LRVAEKGVCAGSLTGGGQLFSRVESGTEETTIEIYSAESCEEVARLLEQTHPELIFTGKLLSGGTLSTCLKAFQCRPTLLWWGKKRIFAFTY
jgi:hypothetical protein